MKKLLFLLLLLLSMIGYSQDYQGVVDGDTTYFLCKFELPYWPYHVDSNRLRMIYADSVKLVGADKHIYFYKTVKPFHPQGLPWCLDTLGASWMGSFSIRKPNGDEWYFNFKGDSILIKTQASLNDNWRITTDSNGLEIWGTLTQVDYTTVDSQADTVKVITLQAYAGGLPAAHLHNNRQIRLSKHHGFLSLFEWDFFPYTAVSSYTTFFMPDTQLHHRLDKHYVDMDLNYINVQTMFNPGTYWQTRDSGYYWGGPLEPPRFPGFVGPPGLGLIDAYTQDSVISKTILSPDSLIVAFQRILRYHYSAWSPPIPPNMNGTYHDSTMMTTYVFTDTIVRKPRYTIRGNVYPESKLSFNYANSLFPKIANIPTFSFIKYSDSVVFLRNNYNTEESMMFSAQYNCIGKYSGVSGKFQHCTGYIRQMDYRPRYRYQWNGTMVEGEDLSYMYFYHDSTVTIGTPLNLKSLPAEDISKAENTIRVFPNPSANGLFHLHTTVPLHWEVYSLRGEWLISGTGDEVNLSLFPNGLYLLKAISNGKVYYSKLMRL